MAGFINALFLLFVAFFIFSEAVEVTSFSLNTGLCIADPITLA